MHLCRHKPIINRRNNSNLGLSVFFGCTFGKYSLGSAIFYTITRSAFNFTDCIWHIREAEINIILLDYICLFIRITVYSSRSLHFASLLMVCHL